MNLLLSDLQNISIRQPISSIPIFNHKIWGLLNGPITGRFGVPLLKTFEGESPRENSRGYNSGKKPLGPQKRGSPKQNPGDKESPFLTPIFSFFPHLKTPFFFFVATHFLWGGKTREIGAGRKKKRASRGGFRREGPILCGRKKKRRGG